MRHDENKTDFAIEAIKNRTVAAFAAHVCAAIHVPAFPYVCFIDTDTKDRAAAFTSQVCAGIPVPVIPYICHYAAYTAARAAFNTGTASANTNTKPKGENENENRTID